MRIRKIMVPIIGNSADDEAIELACEIAKKDKGKILLIHVIEVKRALPLEAEVEPEIQKGEQALEEAEQIVKKRTSCPVQIELLQAREAGPALVEEAVERGIDLIILGLDYKTPFGEFSLGATVPYILENAPCRVWLCRKAMPGVESG